MSEELGEICGALEKEMAMYALQQKNAETVSQQCQGIILFLKQKIEELKAKAAEQTKLEVNLGDMEGSEETPNILHAEYVSTETP